MSLRRVTTTSPLIGWPLKASPLAVQSLSVPSSKPKFSGLPSAPTGRMPSPWAGAATRAAADATAAKARRRKTSVRRARRAVGFGWLMGAADSNGARLRWGDGRAGDDIRLLFFPPAHKNGREVVVDDPAARHWVFARSD